MRIRDLIDFEGFWMFDRFKNFVLSTFAKNLP